MTDYTRIHEIFMYHAPRVIALRNKDDYGRKCAREMIANLRRLRELMK